MPKPPPQEPLMDSTASPKVVVVTRKVLTIIPKKSPSVESIFTNDSIPSDAAEDPIVVAPPAKLEKPLPTPMKSLVVGEKEEPVTEEVDPIISRKTRKKKNSVQKLPAKGNKSKPAVVESPNRIVAEDPPPQELTVAEVEPPLDPLRNTLVTGLSGDQVDPADMVPVFMQVMEKSSVLISQLEELNSDGSLHLRISALQSADQLHVIIDGISRLCGPICNLARFNNLDHLAAAKWHPQSDISGTVLKFLADALVSIITVADQLILGLTAKIDEIQAIPGKKRLKRTIPGWNRQLILVKDLKKIALQAQKDRITNQPTEEQLEILSIPDEAYLMKHGIVPPSSSDKEKIREKDEIVEDLSMEKVSSAMGSESEAGEESVSLIRPEAYMEQLLTAVHDFVYKAEVRQSPNERKRKKGKKMTVSNPEPWIALAAATGLDPANFDSDQQQFLVSCIQKQFPDPRVLVALIIENPSDPRLNFDHLLKNVDVPSSSRVAILEQQLLMNRMTERKLETKLYALKRKNNSWRSNVMALLGVQEDGMHEDGDASNEEWIDDE
jgi:hypothetical protein